MIRSGVRRRSGFDAVISQIADYVAHYQIGSAVARETAYYCLLDSVGCACAALANPQCASVLGPLVAGSVVPHGARVPGTPFVLDPVEATFNTGALIRWLDYNDTFYGATVVHPSDTLAAVLCVSDWVSQQRAAHGCKPFTVAEVLDSAIKAYEIAGVLALANAYTTKYRLDHVILVKIACAAIATHLLGGRCSEIMNAVSNAWIDGHPLAIYRRGADTGARKSWASADAASRGVWLAMMAVKGEMGYASALTAPTWGFYDVYCSRTPFSIERAYGTYVMENVQFKLSYPAAFHAQTAAEAAVILHGLVKHRIDDIARVELWTHAYGLSYLDRTGPLKNFAERDHCLQYIISIALIFGNITTKDYEDDAAADPRIDALRAKTIVREDTRYSSGFVDPRRRSNANAVRVTFKDGSQSERVEVEYPIGHPHRRNEALPLLMRKFEQNISRTYASKKARMVLDACNDRQRLTTSPVTDFLDLLVV